MDLLHDLRQRCVTDFLSLLGSTVFTRVIHALFLTKILYLNLGCVIYARKRFYVGLSGYTGNFLNIVLKA